LGIDLGTDIVPAIAMAYEQPEADLMMRKPRDSKLDRLVTERLVLFSYFQIGIIQVFCGMLT